MKLQASKRFLLCLSGALVAFAGVSHLMDSASHAESSGSARAIELRLVKVKGKAVFNQTDRDRCDFDGVLTDVPAGFRPEGTVLDFHIGGAWVAVTLDERGRNVPELDQGGQNKFKLKFNFKKEFPGGDLNFRLKSKGTWQQDWVDEGITSDRSAKKEQITMTADMRVNTEPRVFTSFNPLLTSKPNKVAKFAIKLPR